MNSISVFCGSSSGNNPVFEQSAYELGALLASKKIKLVYGGAKVGLMGSVANGALENGGEVIGVIPGFLKNKEIAHDGLTQLIEVDNMHERKIKMYELSDGVIALPGGFGTMEEFFEILTWSQLGLHTKPMGLLNIAGFYDALVQQFNVMVENKLLREANHEMVLVADTATDMLSKMDAYEAPEVDKWITRQKT